MPTLRTLPSLLLALAATTSTTLALAITQFTTDTTVAGDQGSCISTVTFDSSDTVHTVRGCIGLQDASDGYGVTLHCDGFNEGICGTDGHPAANNECGCGMWVNFQDQHAFVTYDADDSEYCSLPGAEQGYTGGCVQREGSGYPIPMSY